MPSGRTFPVLGFCPKTRGSMSCSGSTVLPRATILDCSPRLAGECAGAAEVMPRKIGVGACEPELPRREAIDSRGTVGTSGGIAVALTMTHLLRVSLGGFQEKLCVTARPEDWAGLSQGHRALSSAALPLDGAPSTHILKPQPQGRLAGLVEAEAWGMEVARHVTETAGSAILDLPDAPSTLVVERFDRVETERGLVRLHQEDCAQARHRIRDASTRGNSDAPTKSDPTYKGIAAEPLSRHADSLKSAAAAAASLREHRSGKYRRSRQELPRCSTGRRESASGAAL